MAGRFFRIARTFFKYWKLGEVIFGLLVDWPLKIDRPYEIQIFSYLVVATESEFSILLPRSPGSLPMLEASESGPQVRKTPTPHEILWEPPVLRRRWILIGLISKNLLFMLDSLLFQRTVLIDGLYCFLKILRATKYTRNWLLADTSDRGMYETLKLPVFPPT